MLGFEAVTFLALSFAAYIGWRVGKRKKKDKE